MTFPIPRDKDTENLLKLQSLWNMLTTFQQTQIRELATKHKATIYEIFLRYPSLFEVNNET